MLFRSPDRQKWSSFDSRGEYSFRQTNVVGRGCEGGKHAERLDPAMLVPALTRNGGAATVPDSSGSGQEHEFELAALSHAHAVRSAAQAHGTVERHASGSQLAGRYPTVWLSFPKTI